MAKKDKAKVVCPVSREEFKKSAVSQPVKIGDVPMVAGVKEFGTGSIGWYANGKVVIQVNGKQVPVQVGLTLTVIGSKELP